MNNVTEDATQLLNGLDNPIVEMEAEVVNYRTQSDLLRNSTYEFIRNHQQFFSKHKQVLNHILDKIDEKVMTNELSPDQMLSVFSTISNKLNEGTEITMRPFEPAPQGSSPLLPPPKEAELEDNFQKGINAMSGQDSALLNAFIKKIMDVDTTQKK